MGYIDRLLENGEKVEHRAKLPRLLFAPAAISLAVALVTYLNEMPVLSTLFMVLGVLAGIYAGVMYSAAEYAVTNRRVLARVGFKNKVPWAVPFGDIEEVRVDQGGLGGLLNYGTVHVKDRTGTTRSLANLSRPHEFRKRIEDHMKPELASQV